jgi:cation:H+ antiporter
VRPEDELTRTRPTRQIMAITLAAAGSLPGAVIVFGDADVPHVIGALAFGTAIVGAAFLLSWAAEAAQLDVSAGLALAALALVAVLPEYAVDFVFAWQGGTSFEQFGPTCPPLGDGTESPCSLALANMTGANRLLIGIGWSMVVLIAFRRSRERTERRPWPGVKLDRRRSIEIAFLAAATIYSLTLPLKTSITLVDSAVLVTIFVAYSIRVATGPAEAPHLVGPAAFLGTLRPWVRRSAVCAMFAGAAVAILMFAEPFAHALVESGTDLGISEFFLVQWLAPLASEAPELLVAGMYAWRLNANAGLSTLVSSKVNQWTLLVGTLPIVFAIASGGFHGLPIESRQRQELFLTAAQSFFAVAVLSNLSMSLREAGLLFALFWAQFILGAALPESMHGTELIIFGAVYLVLGARTLLSEPRRMPRLLRDGFRASHEELSNST